MIQLAVVAAIAAVAGGVVAIAGRNGSLAALGLFVAMFAAPLASSPEPGTLAIVFRVLGALLAAYLLGASARSQSIESAGSAIGIGAEVALAAAAFVVGWSIVPVKPLVGPIAAQAAGTALVALAVVPLTGRNVFRAGVGVALLALGFSVLAQAWVRPATALEQVVLTALLVGIAGATSLMISPPGRGMARVRATAKLREVAAEADVAAEGDIGAAAGTSSAEGNHAVQTQVRAKVDPRVDAEFDAEAQPLRPVRPATPAALSPRARHLHPREPRR